MKNTVQVLHMEDEPSLTELAADFLEREHDRIEVLSETDVGDALRRLEKTHIDCIVSDYDIPNTDGLEFLEAVREDHPDMTPDIAEVLSTPHVEIEHRGYDVDISPSRQARANE